MSGKVTFRLPLLPPSVNHYVSHGGAAHIKTPETKAFERDFAYLAPKGIEVIGERFHVTLDIFPGPRGRGDVDNRNKVVLDCIAAAGMLVRANGSARSDAWVKRLTVTIHDKPEERALGPSTEVTIEALEV